MAFLIYLFAALVISLSAMADIPEKQCANIDYSNRFGPVRDQDGHGYCYAFTAAALVEEHLCKKNPKHCGKSISPLDISRCQWTLLNEREGGYVNNGLACAINQGGVCFEELAPYNALTNFACTLWDVITGDGVKCKNKKIAGLFTKWKNSCTSDSAAKNQKAISELEQNLIKSLKEQVPEQLLMGKDIRSLFNNSSSESDFLKNVLISGFCESNRKQVNASIKSKTAPNSASEYDQQQMTDFVADGLKNNSSVGIVMDAGLTGMYRYSRNSIHGLVVTGMRYNTWTNSCEFQLRNSYGEGGHFNGWIPVNILQKAILSARYLGEN